MIRAIVNEYGINWMKNRLLYFGKLKLLDTIPNSEKIFEKKVEIKRVDIFDINDSSIKKFLLGLDIKKKEEIILSADKACKGIIKSFSSLELDYGNPINWHYNPITAVEENNKVKWYSIPDFDSERGDIKVIWEPSRFTHFYLFSRAYLLTNDKKYYLAFSTQLNDWLEKNEYSYGSNYKDGQECSLRMISTLMNYEIFRKNGLTTDEDKINVYKMVESSYKKILSNFFYAHKCIKNNHTLSELCGMIIGAWCSQDNNKLKKAYSLLDEVIKEQFLADGGYIQFSFNYQRFALQIIECVYAISRRTGLQLSNNSKELIKASVLFMYQLQDLSGDMPNYGSNDGALIFPVSSCGYRDFSSTINSLFILTTGKRIYKHGDYDEELLWFTNELPEKLPLLNVNRKSISFQKSGFYTFRQNESFLMVLAQDFKTRPAQMDQLHIDLWYKGINVLCDSGTFSYATALGKKMALTSAHNTAKIKEVEQMKKKGAFFIYDWAKTTTTKNNVNEFIGKMISKNGYEHIRSIEKKQNGYTILDRVNCSTDYCDFNFHTICDIEIISNGVKLLYRGKEICFITINNGEFEINKTKRSLYYLKTETINCISIRKKTMDDTCELKMEITFTSK